ncbi:EAL domain-containing protein [Candidatus Gracilibacteria bacterium]|nr:EAL domain-containing protein [Candidatus Gracilibacteria bacterium]
MALSRHSYLGVQEIHKIISLKNGEISTSAQIYEVLICSFEKIYQILKIPENTPINELENTLKTAHSRVKSDIDLLNLQEVLYLLKNGYIKNPLSINLFPFSLSDKRILDMLEESKQYSDFLHIEILEYGYFQGQELSEKNIKQIQDWGYEVGIDDFPCGFNHNDILMNPHIQLDFVKIDKQFSLEYEKEQDSIKKQQHLKKLMKCMQDILDTGFTGRIVIEGIESEEFFEKLKGKISNKIRYKKSQGGGEQQIQVLENIYLQGYFFHKKEPIKKPIISADIIHQIQQNKTTVQQNIIR